MGRPMVPLKAGPWRGMRYSRWSGQADATLAYYAYNGYVDAAGPGAAYRGRPGRYRLSSTQMGSGGPGQLVYQFTKNTGTQYTVLIAGGKFYTFNWATSTPTEVLSAADFAAASITLSATARCFAVTFNNTLVVSDGVNVPWTWDGTTNGGLTKLTNCPVLFGQPTVRVGKLFGIKDTDRVSLVWSEENAANTGYEAGGYSNIWALIQQGSDPLFAIRATNDGLYYWRQRSIGVIRGEFGADFQTSNTFDAVSNLIGTRSPRGLLYWNNTFYFPDEYGRPWAMQPGGAAEPLWQQVALAFPADTDDDATLQALGADIDVSANGLLAMETIPVSAFNGLLFCNSPSNQAGDDSHGGLYFDVGNRAQGAWFWGAPSLVGVGASGEVLNSVTNLPEIVQIEENGYAFAIGKRDVWYDEQADGTDAPISFTLIGPRQGASDGVELQFIQADVVVDASSEATLTLNTEVLTSRSPINTSAQSAAVTSSLTRQEKRVAFGTNRSGRWGHLYVSMTNTNSAPFPVTLHSYTLTAVPLSVSPRVS